MGAEIEAEEGESGMNGITTMPQRKAPQGEGWEIIEINKNYTAWQKGYICALSSVISVIDEHQPAHWEWLVSFSKGGKSRLSNTELRPALKAFCIENFEEDNHEKGIARKFWLAVEEKYRRPCPCKDEMVITEGDYQYSVKVTS